MAYIGRDISNLSDRAVLDNITASATATYNLLLNSVAYVPSSAESLTVSLNGVIQRPPSSYSVSGSTIVFASALTSSDVIDFILAERAITLTTVGTGTITPDKLASSVKSAVIWQSSIKTSNFTASSNEGYWVDTSSNTVTITFPSSPSVGDTIELVDYARNWGTNKIIIDSNGKNYQGDPDTFDVEYNTNGQALRVVYSGTTKGWIPTSDDVVTDVPDNEYSVDFLVIAGGGGGGADYGGGGGAGGYRASYNSEASGGGGSSESAVTVTTGTQYTVSVGAGGTGGALGAQGGSSVFSTITSVGGGGGSGESAQQSGGNGGSGGAGTYSQSGGSGTANQGFNGGSGSNDAPYTAGGGGGASAVGANGGSTSSGNGGNGVASTITGSSTTRAGGGGGGYASDQNKAAGTGGSGGGGSGGATSSANGNSGGANTGGGGGGAGGSGGSAGGNGGSGVVILRMPTAKYSGTTTGSPSVTTNGSDTILTYTGSGSYTA